MRRSSTLFVLTPLVALALPACAPQSQQTAAPVCPCVASASAPPSATAAVPAGATAPLAPRSPQLEALGQQRVDLARKRIDALSAQYQRGMGSMRDVLAAYRDMAFAARDSGLRGDALRRPLEEYRDATIRLRDLARDRATMGSVPEVDVYAAEASIAEAEYWLVEAKARP